MFDLEEVQKQINNYKKRILDIGTSLNISKLENELSNLEAETTKQDFWNDTDNSGKILAKITDLKRKTSLFRKIEDEINTISEMLELISNEDDSEIEVEITQSLKNIQKKVDDLEISTLLSDKYDENNAIITIHPGAGGTEAQDWAEMLYRMYTRWSNSKDFKVEELDYLEGDGAGIKSVTFSVTGPYSYGYLKGEHGVHRLVRISPFDSGGRRHTSFASVEVLPEIKDDSEIYINPDDDETLRV